MPAREEPPERRLFGRLDLAPQRRERGAPQTAEHVRVAPLALEAAGTELAADERVLALELAKQGLDVHAEPCVRLRGRERPAPARVAPHELSQRVGAAAEECVRQPGRRHHAERVAVAPCVLGCDQCLARADARAQRAPLAHERLREAGIEVELVPAQPQLVVQLVGVARVAAEGSLDLGERVDVDQLPQLLLAEQLAQQIAVERQSLSTPFRGRCVVLVHVGGDVVEEERRRERRGARRLDVGEVDLARL